MMNLSVLVHENDGSPHLHLYLKILSITLVHVSARTERVEIYNCDDKFFFNSWRVLHRHNQDCSCSEPPYAGTASNLPPEIQVDHINNYVLCICYLHPHTPCTWDRGITKLLTLPSAKIGYISCTKGTF